MDGLMGELNRIYNKYNKKEKTKEPKTKTDVKGLK